MKITGIICEYNPLHRGHKKQLDLCRKTDTDGGIVCLMSGNFVQRGMPAIIDKSLRAKAAVLCGADLVLELPVTASLSSAEGFAAAGVQILSPFCSHLCFGAETADTPLLLQTATALLSDDFSTALRFQLEQGLSFPAARQNALELMGLDSSLLQQPNNILAVEYCKAILQQDSNLQIMPIVRFGDYHDLQADRDNPSATAVRQLMQEGKDWRAFIPEAAVNCFKNTVLHTLVAGEKAILAKLRTMTDEEFETLPYGSEGLWRKLMHASRKEATLDAIITATKSKRYTRTRLDRMIMCAFLGISHKLLYAPVPYVRVLALNDRGREILKIARQSGVFTNAGQEMEHPYQSLENRWGDLYGLFAQQGIDPPGVERNRRVFYNSKEFTGKCYENDL